jgi:predicted anti-sigma-YlaC factor YlaD
MNCEEVRELLLTDYIDGQIREDLHMRIHQHLNTCSKCRAFQQDLIQRVVEPFKKAEKPKVPTELWYSVKKAITGQRQRKGLLVDFLVNLQIFVQARKPAFAFVSVVAVVLLVVALTQLSFNKQDVVNTYLEEQIDFLVYLSASSDVDDLGIDYLNLGISYIDLGTSIEKYLM